MAIKDGCNSFAVFSCSKATAIDFSGNGEDASWKVVLSFREFSVGGSSQVKRAAAETETDGLRKGWSQE